MPLSVVTRSADLAILIILRLCLSVFHQMTMSLQGLDGTEAATVGSSTFKPQLHFSYHWIMYIIVHMSRKKPPSLTSVVAMAMHNYLLALLSLMCGNYVHNRFSSLLLAALLL